MLSDFADYDLFDDNSIQHAEREKRINEALEKSKSSYASEQVKLEPQVSIVRIFIVYFHLFNRYSVSGTMRQRSLHQHNYVTKILTTLWTISTSNVHMLKH